MPPTIKIQSASTAAAVTIGQLDTLYAVVPTWGEWYNDLALRFTIPAFLMSARACPAWRNIVLRIVTDRPKHFAFLLNEIGICVEFYAPRLMQHDFGGELFLIEGKPRDARNMAWRAFRNAHADILASTPTGAVTVLLNSDTIISYETMGVVHRALAAGKRVVASTGVRTSIDRSQPEVSQASLSTGALAHWIWSNRHHISVEATVGEGNCGHPTVIYFQDDTGNVAMRCFHMCPMFVLSDGRALHLRGHTIDDDLLDGYAEHDIFYPEHGEFVVAEISPCSRMQQTLPGGLMTAQTVADFWSRKEIHSCHIINFHHRVMLLGEMPTGKYFPGEKEIVDAVNDVIEHRFRKVVPHGRI
jgi:hypothetical protein